MAHEPVVPGSPKVHIRDSTLREGQDVPGVDFSKEQKLRIASLLDQAKVPEIEIVAPGRVFQDGEFAKRVKDKGFQTKTSGLVFASSPRCKDEVKMVGGCLDHLDILMPLSELRKPYDRSIKTKLLLDALDYSMPCAAAIGVGFPHSTQVAPEFLLEICLKCVDKGANRILVYDTNGSADPFAIYDLIKRLKAHVKAPLVFHAHNDLGLATANSLAAILAGADGLDTTVNGLGDRAGNASLEQIVMILHLKGMETGISLNALRQLSETVERESGVQVSRLAPIVGAFVATHKSPGHLEIPGLFEAFDPSLVGLDRKVDR
jgi:isopropylmalate/homocitrate/citramalate synthase